jgi:hypothetical protein
MFAKNSTGQETKKQQPEGKSLIDLFFDAGDKILEKFPFAGDVAMVGLMVYMMRLRDGPR